MCCIVCYNGFRWPNVRNKRQASERSHRIYQRRELRSLSTHAVIHYDFPSDLYNSDWFELRYLYHNYKYQTHFRFFCCSSIIRWLGQILRKQILNKMQTHIISWLIIKYHEICWYKMKFLHFCWIRYTTATCWSSLQNVGKTEIKGECNA
jgi:hypothetical protein